MSVLISDVIVIDDIVCAKILLYRVNLYDIKDINYDDNVSMLIHIARTLIFL